ncbi:MAG: hypothetical protein ACLQGU_12790 [bacterium]
MKNIFLSLGKFAGHNIENQATQSLATLLANCELLRTEFLKRFYPEINNEQRKEILFQTQKRYRSGVCDLRIQNADKVLGLIEVKLYNESIRLESQIERMSLEHEACKIKSRPLLISTTHLHPQKFANHKKVNICSWPEIAELIRTCGKELKNVPFQKRIMEDFMEYMASLGISMPLDLSEPAFKRGMRFLEKLTVNEKREIKYQDDVSGSFTALSIIVTRMNYLRDYFWGEKLSRKGFSPYSNLYKFREGDGSQTEWSINSGFWRYKTIRGKKKEYGLDMYLYNRQLHFESYDAFSGVEDNWKSLVDSLTKIKTRKLFTSELGQIQGVYASPFEKSLRNFTRRYP